MRPEIKVSAHDDARQQLPHMMPVQVICPPSSRPHPRIHLKDLEGGEVLEQHRPPLTAVFPRSQLDQPRLKPDVTVQVKVICIRLHIGLDLRAIVEEIIEGSAAAGQHPSMHGHCCGTAPAMSIHVWHSNLPPESLPPSGPLLLARPPTCCPVGYSSLGSSSSG